MTTATDASPSPPNGSAGLRRCAGDRPNDARSPGRIRCRVLPTLRAFGPLPRNGQWRRARRSATVSTAVAEGGISRALTACLILTAGAVSGCLEPEHSVLPEWAKSALMLVNGPLRGSVALAVDAGGVLTTSPEPDGAFSVIALRCPLTTYGFGEGRVEVRHGVEASEDFRTVPFGIQAAGEGVIADLGSWSLGMTSPLATLQPLGRPNQGALALSTPPRFAVPLANLLVLANLNVFLSVLSPGLAERQLILSDIESVDGEGGLKGPGGGPLLMANQSRVVSLTAIDATRALLLTSDPSALVVLTAHPASTKVRGELLPIEPLRGATFMPKRAHWVQRGGAQEVLLLSDDRYAIGTSLGWGDTGNLPELAEELSVARTDVGWMAASKATGRSYVLAQGKAERYAGDSVVASDGGTLLAWSKAEGLKATKADGTASYLDEVFSPPSGLQLDGDSVVTFRDAGAALIRGGACDADESAVPQTVQVLRSEPPWSLSHAGTAQGFFYAIESDGSQARVRFFSP